MILDGHIHIWDGPVKRDEFIDRLGQAGIDGGLVISLRPDSFQLNGPERTVTERLDNLFEWVGSHPDLYPFFWIDPIEEGALEQVAAACAHGVRGFKVICNRFYPGDERAMEVYRAIAKAGKPILFHSGILWDGQPSAKYNRPGEFEALLEVSGLKFALAHVSWPWCDENIAVYGKFLNAYNHRPDLSVEMFIDITPGTPPIYRAEVLTKLFTVGYDIEDNIIFGVDCVTTDYHVSWATEWMQRDNGIYSKLGLNDEILTKIYGENLKRFIGISDRKVQKRPVVSS